MSSANVAPNVVILDRDGTIVIDRGYLADPDGLEFTAGAPEALRRLGEAGHKLVVITNQSGVGRGFFAIEQLEAMNVRLQAMVEGIGARLTKIYVCPHAPADNCTCRKPNLGLMDLAAAELNFDPRSAVVVGDRESDMEFARRAGARGILISSSATCGNDGAAPNVTVRTLLEASWLIVPVNASKVFHNEGGARQVK